MTTERDMTRIVRSWLRTDEHESAGRVLDNVLAALDTTPQRRRPLLPAWRIPPLNTYAKLAIAAAVVVVVAVVGYNVLPGIGTGPGGQTPSASPCVPVASPAGTPPPDFPPSGKLPVGSCQTLTLEGVGVAFQVPTEGWVSNGDFGIDHGTIGTPDNAGFILWTDAPVGVFADPCGHIRGPEIGASPADLADAVATLPGSVLVSGPTDVSVGGFPAKHVVIKIPDTIGCAPNAYFMWYAPTAGFERYATDVNWTVATWIVDVNGSIVWVDGETFEGAGPGPAREIQKIVDAMVFGS